MFKNILLVTAESLSKEGYDYLGLIEETLKNKKIWLNSTYLDSRRNLDTNKIKNKDLVITLGGDGTFLSVARYLKDTPILGINFKPEYSEGYLTSIKASEIEKLSRILLGKYSVLVRQRAKAKVKGFDLETLALNEVFIGPDKSMQTATYEIEYKGKKEIQRSSGVIVSTGSGSTGVYNSAKGKPFPSDSKNLKFIVREPKKSGSLYIPKITQGTIGKKESLSFKSFSRHGCVIKIDAHNDESFLENTVVEVSLSDVPLNVIVL
ncbi:MAG: NAD(+)/NADH kinase [Candidatus Pacearchaeota archaeon]|jgi:NAD kinase